MCFVASKLRLINLHSTLPWSKCSDTNIWHVSYFQKMLNLLKHCHFQNKPLKLVAKDVKPLLILEIIYDYWILTNKQSTKKLFSFSTVSISSKLMRNQLQLFYLLAYGKESMFFWGASSTHCVLYKTPRFKSWFNSCGIRGI
jgi:hypothetical protein